MNLFKKKFKFDNPLFKIRYLIFNIIPNSKSKSPYNYLDKLNFNFKNNKII